MMNDDLQIRNQTIKEKNAHTKIMAAKRKNMIKESVRYRQVEW